MPKMKTNRLASKKFRVTGSGRVKSGRSGLSHNTGKKSSKYNRNLSGKTLLHKHNEHSIKQLLGIV